MERNPDIPFTYEYSQPEEYHFSIDSIEMPWMVAQHLKQKMADGELTRKDLEKFQVLDLCAGTGVLGFELNYHLPEIKKIDFVEVQSVYQTHFDHNKNLALEHNKKIPVKPTLAVVREGSDLPKSNEPNFQFLNVNYDQLMDEAHHEKYDVILCNPPYFLEGQGKMSPSEFKNRCRFFLDSSFENLARVLCHTLKQQGETYLLLRSLDDHGLDLLQSLRRFVKGQLECESLGEVRGTMLLKLYR